MVKKMCVPPQVALLSNSKDFAHYKTEELMLSKDISVAMWPAWLKAKGTQNAVTSPQNGTYSSCIYVLLNC